MIAADERREPSAVRIFVGVRFASLEQDATRGRVTNGDGVDDNVEVIEQTDPNDPLDFPSRGQGVPALGGPAIALLIGSLLIAAGVRLRRR